jgi:hypothetical protein
MIEKRADHVGITKRHVYTLVRRYFQRGMMPNALLPAYDNSARKGVIRGPRRKFLPKQLETLTEQFLDNAWATRTVKGLYALFVRYLRKYFDKKKWTLANTFQKLTEDVFNCGKFSIDRGKPVPILLDPSSRPEPHLLLHFYKRYWNKDKSRRARQGELRYGRMSRARNKGTRHMAFGPGWLMQGDATPADIILVSHIRKVKTIGKASIYFFIDHFSHLICGFSIMLRNECYLSVMVALDHVASDKVEYCKRFNVTISEEDWPVKHLPRRILVDRGVLRQWKGNHLVNTLKITVENTPAYRGDLKALVERLHRSIKDRIITHLRGNTIAQEIGDHRKPKREATTTVDGLTEAILAEVIFHNTSSMEYTRTKAMIRDGVEPIPARIWQWGCKKATASLRSIPQDILRLNLLPLQMASVTDEGLKLSNGLLYRCPDELSARARQDGRFRAWVSLDPRALDVVYLRDPHNDLHLIPCLAQDDIANPNNS